MSPASKKCHLKTECIQKGQKLHLHILGFSVMGKNISWVHNCQVSLCKEGRQLKIWTLGIILREYVFLSSVVAMHQFL